MANKELLNTKQAAEFLAMTPKTVGRWRKRRSGPNYTYAGRFVIYEQSELSDWLEKQRRKLESDNRKRDIKGQIFKTANCGDVVVLHYQNYNNVKIEFVNTGHTLVTTKDRLIKSKTLRLRDPLAPTVFGIGRIGVGIHKAHEKCADTEPYRIWRAMLRRCYYKPEWSPSRDGCTVCEGWLCYQVFAAWYQLNHPNDGARYQLDKDIRVQGNKLYSPETCSFVTQAENLAARWRVGRLPSEKRVL